MRALVIGADGFVGGHLVSHLRAEGDTVTEGIGPGGDRGAGRHPIDVRDADAVRDLVRAERPDAIYHLAAVAYGPDAASDLGTALAITVAGTANMLEAARAVDPPPTVLVPGSSEVYGTPEKTPINEAAALRPVNLYGATKVAQESIALTFGRVHDMPVVVTRSFNHIGPGQRAAFAVASFARQLHQIEIGGSDATLRVGNLAPVRDFSDVRDVVRAYRLLVAGGHAGQPINVASGRGVSIGELVESLITASGLDVRIEVDPARVRRGEAERIVGDNTRLRNLTGWAPEVPLAQTLADIWADTRRGTDGVPA